MMDDFDDQVSSCALTWRCWRLGHHTTPGRDATTTWTKHYLHIGPLSTYWRTDIEWRADADFSGADIQTIRGAFDGVEPGKKG